MIYKVRYYKQLPHTVAQTITENGCQKRLPKTVAKNGCQKQLSKTVAKKTVTEKGWYRILEFILKMNPSLMCKTVAMRKIWLIDRAEI